MLKREVCSICIFYAISPIHAGSGVSTSAVDLPIQRERHTNWPIIQASAVKGAFRSHFRNYFSGQNGNVKLMTNLIFGSDTQDDWGQDKENLPGAVSISDARLFAFPVRSNVAPFVWITCPAVVARFNTDLEYADVSGNVGISDLVVGDQAIWINAGVKEKQIVLEDAVVEVKNHLEDQFLRDNFPELSRLLLVSDQMFDYAVSCWTEIQAQIKINAETGTTEDGSLRYEEFLPADSVLYSIFYYSGHNITEIPEEDRNNEIGKAIDKMAAENFKGLVEDSLSGFIQIGGDETLGKGICRIGWLSGGEV